MGDEVTMGARGGAAHSDVAWTSGSTRTPTVTSVAGRGERGAVTAEAAVVIPLLVAVAMVVVWLVALATTQVRVVDAAREAARAAARGETDAIAVDRGRQVAPDRARFDLTRSGDEVTVRVVAEVRGPGGLLRFLPAVSLRSEAVAAQEPAAADGAE